MLVDPDDLLRWSLAIHLLPSMSVTAARDLAEAEPYLRNDAFDVVILSTDNANELREIEYLARTHNRNLSLIHLTTKVKSNMLVTGIYLEKPFRFHDLDEILKRLLSPNTAN